VVSWGKLGRRGFSLEEDSPLLKAFMFLPLLAGGLFFWNHFEWVERNGDALFPVAVLVGAFLFYKLFPNLWNELRGAIPVILVALGLLAGLVYLIFGGTGDGGGGMGTRAREQYIDNIE
jgi:hypothetical protein